MIFLIDLDAIDIPVVEGAFADALDGARSVNADASDFLLSC